MSRCVCVETAAHVRLVSLMYSLNNRFRGTSVVMLRLREGAGPQTLPSPLSREKEAGAIAGREPLSDKGLQAGGETKKNCQAHLPKVPSPETPSPGSSPSLPPRSQMKARRPWPALPPWPCGPVQADLSDRCRRPGLGLERVGPACLCSVS